MCMQNITWERRKQYICTVLQNACVCMSSDFYIVYKPLTVPSGPPENFTVDVISSTEILLMWQPPASEIQNGLVRLYTVIVFEVQTNTSYSHTVASEESALLVESLHPYYDYVCSVTAVTIGPGPYTSSLTVRTFEDGELITRNPLTLHVHDMASSEISSNHM